MALTPGDIMHGIHNFFPKSRMDGVFELRGGQLSAPCMLLEGDWVALCGARQSGVYCLGEGGRIDGVQDEQFEGTVWLLCPPPAFLALCDEIIAWEAKHPQTALKRESFGAYSCEAMTDANGLPMGWMHVFASHLVPWRRMFTGVRL